MSTTTVPENLVSPAVRKHPVYWFEDGTLTLEVGSQHFLVHRTLLSRHSPVLSKSDTRCISLRSNYRADDIEALLQCLYHDKPLRNDSPFGYVASILRITSPSLLDFPYFHATAREIIEKMFSTTPAAFTHDYPLSEALLLATDFDLRSVRKALLYTLVTTKEFDVPYDDDIDRSPLDPEKVITTKVEVLHSDSADFPTLPPPAPSDEQDGLFSPELTRICTMLLSRIIDRFTPILFTPATTPHMECTDVFAETWGPMVIMPAIEDNGVYKPLETLGRLKEIDWAKHGLCASCVEEKRKEWTDEQVNVWNLMERWLSEV